MKRSAVGWGLLLMQACGGGAESPAPEPEPAAGVPAAPRSEREVEAPAGPLPRIATLSEVAHWAVGAVVSEEAVRVELLPPLGADPGEWQPSGAEVAALAEAELIVANGAGYEAWTATAALPAQRLVVLTEGQELIERAGAVHSHGREGAHSHGTVDAHTWMDLEALAASLEGLEAAIGARLPGVVDPEGRAAVQARLRAVDADWHRALAPLRGSHTVATSHPAFAYLGRRHGLRLLELDLDPEAPPSPDQVAAVRAWADAAPVDVLWWEARPSGEAFLPLGGGVHHVVVDPLEHGLGEGEPLDLLVQAGRVTAALEETAQIVRELTEAPTGPR